MSAVRQEEEEEIGTHKKVSQRKRWETKDGMKDERGFLSRDHDLASDDGDHDDQRMSHRQGETLGKRECDCASSPSFGEPVSGEAGKAGASSSPPEPGVCVAADARDSRAEKRNISPS